ncbi:MAG: hypothetical protein JW839_07510, partial [Candidatus Lokiarchaeota archaeon]|nr:hypothetical protein [Candidatus Lokiarchaeota archaeon]
SKVKGNTIKILIVGSRYTGKGQIGREWGQTDADLPTLQPVILYERDFIKDDLSFRVVAWVLSYDPEFADIRRAFFPGAHGVVFTYDITDDPTSSLLDLDQYERELKRTLLSHPPSILVGVRLNATKEVSSAARARGLAWAKDRGIEMVEADFLDRPQFASAVDKAFTMLIKAISLANKYGNDLVNPFKMI